MSKQAEKLLDLQMRYLAKRGGTLGQWWRDSMNWLFTNELHYMKEEQ